MSQANYDAMKNDLSPEAWRKRRAMDMDIPTPANTPGCPALGSIWWHYKGRPFEFEYQVKGFAREEGTNRVLVLYDTYAGAMHVHRIPWSRPLEDWNAMVAHEGKTVPRFSLSAWADGHSIP